MSTESAPQPTPVNGPQVRRPARPQFISLSELSNQPRTFRDLMALLPAAIISLAFNTALVLMLWYTQPTARAEGEELDKFRSDEQIKQAELTKKEDPLDSIPINPPDEEVMSEPAIPPPDPLPLEAPMASEPPPGAAAPSGPEIPLPAAAIQPGFRGLDDAGAMFKDGIFKPGQAVGQAGIALPGADGKGTFIGLKGSFHGRGTAAAKNYLVNTSGGNERSEQAVLRGLKWLARHQSPDGKWSLNNYHVHNRECTCKTPGEANVPGNDTAGTAFGLLPFLAAGITHKSVPEGSHKDLQAYTKNVQAALNALVRMQKNSNNPREDGHLGGEMYSHSIATIALCEAYGLSNDKSLRGPAQRAVNYLIAAQNRNTGGWRYSPGQDGDTSVVGWVVMALRSGQMAGLNVPKPTMDGASKWLDSCAKASGTSKLAMYSYTPDSGPTPRMTAAGLLNREYLGWGPRNPDLQAGCKVLMQSLPPKTGDRVGEIYYYYSATQVLHHMDDDNWKKWNDVMREHLIRCQEKAGHKDGSWGPEGVDFGNAAGRLYSTSLSLLTLEVYYRHLPLYRRDAAMTE